MAKSSRPRLFMKIPIDTPCGIIEIPMRVHEQRGVLNFTVVYQGDKCSIVDNDTNPTSLRARVLEKAISVLTYKFEPWIRIFCGWTGKHQLDDRLQGAFGTLSVGGSSFDVTHDADGDRPFHRFHIRGEVRPDMPPQGPGFGHDTTMAANVPDTPEAREALQVIATSMNGAHERIKQALHPDNIQQTIAEAIKTQRFDPIDKGEGAWPSPLPSTPSESSSGAESTAPTGTAEPPPISTTSPTKRRRSSGSGGR